MDWLQTDDAIQLLKTIGLLLFFAIFTGVVLWVVLQRKSKIRRWAALPLEDEPKEGDLPKKDKKANAQEGDAAPEDNR